MLAVVEDVHWFDEVSASVIGAVGRRISDPRLRIVATSRSQPGARFGASWAELELGPLSDTDAARLIDESPPSKISDHARPAGDPRCRRR